MDWYWICLPRCQVFIGYHQTVVVVNIAGKLFQQLPQLQNLYQESLDQTVTKNLYGNYVGNKVRKS